MRALPARKAVASMLMAWILALSSPPWIHASAVDLPSRSDIAEATGTLHKSIAALDHLADAAFTGGLADMIRAAADVEGVTLQGKSHLGPSPAPAEETQLQGPLAGPLGKLLEAIQRAENPLAQVMGANAATIGRLEGQADDLLKAADETLASHQGGPELPGGFASRLEKQSLAVEAGLEGAIDRSALFSGTLLLAQAIDVLIPRLASRSEPMEGDTGSALGCDVQDVPGLICVGGSGNNVYETFYPVVIDLGGNDTYRNDPGGAVTTKTRPVSIALDVQGDDTYESGAVASGEPGGAIGYGAFGGVGFVVDVTGNDRYSLRVPEDSQLSSTNGLGSGYIGGAGVLADLGGSDVYSAVSRPQQASCPVGATGASALGVATGGGLGLLVDAGGSDDRYEIESLPQAPCLNASGQLRIGAAAGSGFGVGAVGGTGVFLDEGGTDSMTIHAETAPYDPGETRPFSADNAADATGFGVSVVGGVGLHVTGPGRTIRTAHSVSGEPVSVAGAGHEAQTRAFGEADIGGYGALHDLGGDDVYTAVATSRAVRELDVTDDCGCSGSPLVVEVGNTVVAAQGASLSGDGLLHDAQGNDTYVARAEAVAVARVRDHRASPPKGQALPALATTDPGVAQISAQGAGLLGGSGLLLDDAGDDVYEASTLSKAEASAVADEPGLHASALATSGYSNSRAQAVGIDLGLHGLLRDLGGEDTYVSGNYSAATADPPTLVSSQTGSARVQGSWVGTSSSASSALLIDIGGSADVFKATPENPACSGVRGQSAWTDCGRVGLGFND